MDPKSQIQNELKNFEQKLAELINSIRQFNPSVNAADELIEANQKLSDAIGQIKVHQKLQTQRLHLEKMSKDLDAQMTHLLLELAECRKDLQSSTTVSENEAPKKVNAKDLLAYATRITKFTKAPPNFSNQEPATLPWPTEDEMRKGMLATQDSLKQEAADAKTNSTAKPVVEHQPVLRRRSSLVEYGERPVMGNPVNGSNGSIDLGLFETDDEEG